MSRSFQRDASTANEKVENVKKDSRKEEMNETV